MGNRATLSHESPGMLGWVQELRFEDESFCLQYPEFYYFFDADKALEIIGARYPHFQFEMVNSLTGEIDQELYQISTKEKGILARISQCIAIRLNCENRDIKDATAYEEASSCG